MFGSLLLLACFSASRSQGERWLIFWKLLDPHCLSAFQASSTAGSNMHPGTSILDSPLWLCIEVGLEHSQEGRHCSEMGYSLVTSACEDFKHNLSSLQTCKTRGLGIHHTPAAGQFTHPRVSRHTAQLVRSCTRYWSRSTAFCIPFFKLPSWFGNICTCYHWCKKD